jgi:phosphonate transport system substrate-binding protein
MKIRGQWLLILTLFLLVQPASAQERQQLTLVVHPYLAAAELIERFTPLTIYLSERLGQEVVLELSADYVEHIEKIGHDQVEIAYMGPASYVQLVEHYGEKPLLARVETGGTPTFQGVIIVRDKADMTSLADLKGKRFAFGDPHSTMSHLLPRYMLLQEGIDLEDLGEFAFIRNHHNVALGVLMGAFDAGAVKEEIYEEFKGKGIRELVRTPVISEHLFVAAGDLPAATVTALRRHLLELGESPAGLAALSVIQHDVTGLVPVADEDYQEMRTIMAYLEERGVVLE